MTSSKRNALSSAVLAALSAGAGTAQAVYDDPSGIGQVLIYPYYTVQTAGGNAFNTYLSVVNNTARAKAVKVRFREGKNSRPVMDFNLYLSPNDVWTAALGPADATANSPAMLVTADRSCTTPVITSAGLQFHNFSYVGVAGDFGPTGLDRTREGYFEIIEMANVTGDLAAAVTHNGSGFPVNCAFVQPASGFSAANNGAFMQPPSGGLSGTYTLINVANGLNFGGNATALSQFSAVPIFTDPGDESPNLGAANPPVATVVVDGVSTLSGPGTTVYTAQYANGRDAVSATMMRSSLMNEFALDTATRSATDWVVTFPTKHLYIGTGGGAAVAPFANNFGITGSCESFFAFVANREEASNVFRCDTLCPPGPLPPSLCFAASTISVSSGSSVTPVAQSLVFGSMNAMGIAASGFQNGWARIGFVSAPAVTTGISSLPGTGYALNINTGATASNATVNMRGLPAIGFMARTLNNGALSCTTFGGSPGTCAGSYGAAFDHKYEVTATPTP